MSSPGLTGGSLYGILNFFVMRSSGQVGELHRAIKSGISIKIAPSALLPRNDGILEFFVIRSPKGAGG